MLTQALHTLAISTRGPGFTDISADLAHWLREVRASNGLLSAFIRHTSASLVIQENADPDVLADLSDWLARAAPRGGPYKHRSEGPDDMPAHIRAMLTATSLAIPVVHGRLALGTWQAVYVAEHRDRPQRREIALHYAGSVLT